MKHPAQHITRNQSDSLYQMLERGQPRIAIGGANLDPGNITIEPELQSINNLYSASENDPEPDRYFYHTDHLGSSSWITDASGNVNQHIQYLPFGEDFIYQRTTSWDVPYTLSGKEKDKETGYSYFGARYYSPELSVWLSVDPLADKYPSMSAYMYTAGNPVMLVDPDGRDNEKPERFGVGKRIKNWLNGDSYKNMANKFQVKNGILKSREDKNGNIYMSKSYTHYNSDNNNTGIIEEDYIFTKDDIIVTQRNSTTANTYSFIIDYKGFKGILILGGGPGRNGYTVGQKGPYFSVVDINKLNNWDSPEEILRKVKNVPLIYKPLDTSEVYMNYKTGKRYRMGDTITWLPNRPFDPNVSHYIKEWQTETSYEVIYKKSNK